MDAGHSFTYRLDEVKLAEGKLLTTKHSIAKKQDDLGRKELVVTPETRVWKGGEQMKLDALKPGDELLFNLTGKSADNPGRCTDVWIGVETHKLTTETQQKKFNDFTAARGVPGWIEKTEGKTVTVTFFSGDTRAFKAACNELIAVGKETKLCVANDELRTWNPGVDGERGAFTEVQKVPTDGYGCSGYRATMTVSNMLEGFRKGRVVRVFLAGWKVQDQFYGESLMGYGFGRMMNQELVENVAKEYPDQFPFRTDYGNAHLPWYRLQPGIKPPPFSEHVVLGELVKVDAATHGGQFLTERTGEAVNFTLTDEGTSLQDAASKPGNKTKTKEAIISARHLGKDLPLAELPTGIRYRFHLFQDKDGRFTRASYLCDEFTRLTANSITARITAMNLDAGRLQVAWQLPEVKDYNGDMKRPPDIGHSILRVNERTRVWKDDATLKLSDLKSGDVLRLNLSGELPGKPAVCTDLWVQ